MSSRLAPVPRRGAPRLAEPLRLPPAGRGVISLPVSLRSLSAAMLAGGCIVAAAVFAHGQLEEVAARLSDANGTALVVAAVFAPLVPAATAGAWRSVLASRGIRLSATVAWGCYGVGSLANTFLPGRAGDALRIELFSRRLPQDAHRRWLACGISASVALAQSAVFGCIVVVGSVLGALPIWLIAPAFALPAATWGAGRFALRRWPDTRIVCLATVATLSPPAWARLLCWVGTAGVARLLLAAAVLEALAVPHALPLALVALCGSAVGNALPFVPGGAGVPATTMAIALVHAGLSTSTAVAAALSLHAFETTTGVVFGAGGWVLLRLAERARNRSRMVLEPEALVAVRVS